MHPRRIPGGFFYALFILLSALPATLCAQENDDLFEMIREQESALKKMSADTDRVYALADLAQLYSGTNISRALSLGYQALKIAEHMRWNKGRAYVYNNLGMLYFSRADYAAALDYFQKAYAYNQKAGFERAYSYNLGNIGAVYSGLQEFDKALEYYHKALELERASGNKQGESFELTNIGSVYRQLGNEAEALKHYLAALKIEQELQNPQGMADNYTGLGLLYLKLREFEKSESYFKKAFEIDSLSGDPLRKAISCGNLGVLYFKMVRDTSYVLQSGISEQLLEESRHCLMFASEVFEDLSAKNELQEMYQSLHELYEFKGDYKTALNYFRKHVALKDSVFSEENKLAIARMEHQKEMEGKEKEILIQNLKISQAKKERYAFITGVFLLGALAFMIFRQRKISDQLLYNVLPRHIALRLKNKEGNIADQVENASIVFIDVVGFTSLSAKHRPAIMVDMLNKLFLELDQLAGSYGLEKIKTIGDCYMVAGGLIQTAEDHNRLTARFALEAGQRISAMQTPSGEKLAFRAGIDCGPVVAGVIGQKKLIYDIWGDAVNTASRMETTSEPGKIQITQRFAEAIGPGFKCTERGELDIKGKGLMRTFYLESEA